MGDIKFQAVQMEWWAILFISHSSGAETIVLALSLRINGLSHHQVSMLLTIVCRHFLRMRPILLNTTILTLETKLKSVWDKIFMETVCATISDFSERLWHMAKVKRNYIEWDFLVLFSRLILFVKIICCYNFFQGLWAFSFAAVFILLCVCIYIYNVWMCKGYKIFSIVFTGLWKAL